MFIFHKIYYCDLGINVIKKLIYADTTIQG